MNIYRIKSAWSTELAAAKDIPAAIEVYRKHNKKFVTEDDDMPIVLEVQFVGKLLT